MKITNSIMKVKKLTVHQIIGVSERIPVSNFNQAVEIAKVFREKILHTFLKASTSMVFGK